MFTYKCTIERIVDGDTYDIVLDLGFAIYVKERVRLEGVDTPEIFGRNATPEGQVAKQFVEDWVAEKVDLPGYFVYRSIKYNAKDKYGRALGSMEWIGDDGTTSVLSEELLNAGLAELYG